MTKRMKRLVWMIVIIAAFLTACSSVKIKDITSTTQPIAKIKSLTVQLEQGLASSKQVKNFKKIVIDELQKSGFSVKETSDVSLTITIEDIQVPSAPSR